jgi:CRISPR-associated protein Csy3
LSNAKDGEKMAKGENTGNNGAKNLQVINYACVPAGCDALLLEFTTTFMGNARSPKSCSGDGLGQGNMKESVDMLMSLYADLKGFEELAYRYLKSIIDGKPLWRNKTMSDEVVCTINVKGMTESKFTGSARKPAKFEKCHPLVKKVAKVLATPGESICLRINLMVDLPEGIEVFPSQCYIPEEKGRILATVERDGVRQGIIHQQKIGNAIRTIDDWYPNAVYPIAVEPLGIDRKLDIAMRVAAKTDLYMQLKNNILGYIKDMQKTKSIPDQVHYIAACFVRGGVFNKG